MGYKEPKVPEKSAVDARTLEIIHEYILGVSNDGSDLRVPHLRASLADSYELVVFAFCLLIAVGFVGNAVVFGTILRNRMYKDATQAFVLNNAICDLVKCLFVLPLSAYVLLVQNWVLGELMCSFLPMIQDIPIHVTTLTFTLMAWDRLRFARNPNRLRLPAFVCCFGTWLTSMCLVLPYPLYIMYVDIGNYVAELDGVGICVYNLVDDMEEYMRGIFLTMYVVPMCLISYMCIRTSQELKNRLNCFSSHRGMRVSTESYIYGHRLLQREIKCAEDSLNSRGGSDEEVNSFPRRPFNMNAVQEKRNQKYLVFTVTVYGICMCPIMVLRLVRFALVETYENSGILDIIYTAFVWFAFAPVCVTPLVHLVWQMSCSSKLRLRCYFRFEESKGKGCRASLENLEPGMPDSFHKRYNLDDRQPMSTGSSSLMDDSNGS